MSASGTIYLTISALIYTIITTILFTKKKKMIALGQSLFYCYVFIFGICFSVIYYGIFYGIVADF